jgi:ABC-type transport system involved in cytochrome bd biosynthesis fused ATPase/permease subunit
VKEPKIIIRTIMSKEDYKKFLYISAFKRNKFTIPFLCLISFIGSVIISFDNGNISLALLILSWLLLFILAIGIVLFKIERKNSQRIKTDKTGTFDSVNTLKFYDDRIVMENKVLKSTGELKYNQFFAVMESKDYFIFYLTATQASLIRKEDIDNLDDFKKFIVKNFECGYKQI